MIKYNSQSTITRKVYCTDPEFYIYHNITVTPRACFEIDTQCPERYKQIIAACIDRGWLKTVAYIRDIEYTYENLIKP